MFTKHTINTYTWKSRQIPFTPKSTYFNSIDFISETHGTLKFETYTTPSTKDQWKLLEADCVAFAEAICSLPCEVSYSGIGQLSQIDVIPKNLF